MKYFPLLLLAIFFIGCGRPKIVSDCDFILPPDFRVSYNENTSKYAIKSGTYILTYSKRYETFDLDVTYHHPSHIAVFNDSCKAKGFYKAYIESLKKQDFK